jgi:hypothetical protein
LATLEHLDFTPDQNINNTDSYFRPVRCRRCIPTHIHDLTFIAAQTDEMGDAEITTSAWRLVEVGRVVLFNEGQYEGRLAAIVEIIDHKRVWIPCDLVAVVQRLTET